MLLQLLEGKQAGSGLFCSKSAENRGTYVGGEDFNPSGFLLSSCVFKTKCHSLFVRVPPLHFVPFECYYLVLKEDETQVRPEPSRLRGRGGLRQMRWQK